jgi:hypothetical protein
MVAEIKGKKRATKTKRNYEGRARTLFDWLTVHCPDAIDAAENQIILPLDAAVIEEFFGDSVRKRDKVTGDLLDPPQY